MQSYALEIIGRSHERGEDAHNERIITTPSGKKWGLFLVADGISGYSGSAASKIAVSAIGQSLEDYLSREEPRANGGEPAPHAEKIKELVLQANEQLRKREDSRTALDLVLVSPWEMYLCHLGSGQVYLVYDQKVEMVTGEETGKTEEKAVEMPTDYLGVAAIGAKSIEERVQVQHAYFELEKPRYLFLTTAGLKLRGTEEEIAEILAINGSYRNPRAILEELSTLVTFPRQKLLRLSEQKIREHFLAGLAELEAQAPPTNGSPANGSSEALVDWVLARYRRREPAELISRLDQGFDSGELKHEDTTMILVDLDDQLGKILGAAHDYDQLWRRCEQVQHFYEEGVRLHDETTAMHHHITGELAFIREERRRWDRRRNKIEQEAEERERRMLRDLESLDKAADAQQEVVRAMAAERKESGEQRWREVQEGLRSLREDHATLQREFDKYRNRRWWRKEKKR